MATDKTPRFIAVPFEQKDEAKALGARWDPAWRCWYIPIGKHLRRVSFPFPDALSTIAAWKEQDARERAKRKEDLKLLRHDRIKAQARAHKPTAQILREADSRLSMLLSE